MWGKECYGIGEVNDKIRRLRASIEAAQVKIIQDQWRLDKLIRVRDRLQGKGAVVDLGKQRDRSVAILAQAVLVLTWGPTGGGILAALGFQRSTTQLFPLLGGRIRARTPHARCAHLYLQPPVPSLLSILGKSLILCVGAVFEFDEGNHEQTCQQLGQAITC